jgi:hypothetical protein
MSGGEKKKGLGAEHPEPLRERRTVVILTAAWIANSSQRPLGSGREWRSYVRPRVRGVKRSSSSAATARPLRPAPPRARHGHRPSSEAQRSPIVVSPMSGTPPSTPPLATTSRFSRPPPNASSLVTATDRTLPTARRNSLGPNVAGGEARGPVCAARRPIHVLALPPSGPLHGADFVVGSGRSKDVGSTGSKEIGSAWPSTSRLAVIVKVERDDLPRATTDQDEVTSPCRVWRRRA